MAIALLNYADDEGYFHAEPNLVRGFCRPFDDDSTITKRCLENLSNIGYISICENELYGSIGLIITFLEHQRIDRPNDSKLKLYYSTKARRKLDDKSKEEGNGKGREWKRKGMEVDFDKILNSYHSICKSYPRVEKVTVSRQAKIKSRFQEIGSYEQFEKIFALTEQSSFMKGNNPKNWKASFDWLIENDTNWVKVIEGKYLKENEKEIIVRPKFRQPTEEEMRNGITSLIPVQ